MESRVTGKRLVPEVRADRNGKLVTRHVKSNFASPRGRDIPAVDRSKQDRAEEKKKREAHTEETRIVLVELTKNGVPVIGVTEAQHNVHYLVKADPALVEEVLQAVRSGTDMEREIWTHELSFTPQTPKDWQDDRDYTEFYRVSILINPLASAIAEVQPETTSKVHFARSLKHYVTEVAKVNGHTDDALWMKAVMLTAQTVSKGSVGQRNNWNFDTHGDDIKFLQENWDRVEPLIPILVQRHNASRAFIETLWESLAPSLSEGLL
jgi:hypothetical protein